MAHRTTATGSSDPGAKKNKRPVVQWAYFKNDGFQVKMGNGSVKRYTRDQWEKIPQPQRDRLKAGYAGASVKEIHKGGTWIRRGSPRWDALKGQGRSPVGQVRSRRMPPEHYGTPGYTAWSTRTGKYDPSTGKGGKTNPYKNPVGPGQTAHGGEDVGGAGGLGNGQNPHSPKPPPKSGGKTLKALMKMMGNGNVGTMLPRKYADALAGMQFDAQIHDLKAQEARQPVQAAQNLSDIRDMYGQVADLNDQAQHHATNAGNQQADSLGALGQALMAAGGGSANGANGMLAGATQDSSALLRALGGIDSQYHSDMAPLLQDEKAGALTNQINLGTQDHQNLALQIADLMGQRGQAKTKAIMDIVAANNALAQQRFGNSLSKMQAAAGVQSIEPDLQLKALQVQDQRLKNRGDAQTVAANGHQGGKLTLSSLNPYQQTQALAPFINAPDGSQRSIKSALKVMHAAGYTTHYAEQLLRSQYLK